MSCPGLEALERYVDGALEEPARREVDSHVSSCASCRERIAEVQRHLDLAGRVVAADACPSGAATVIAGSAAAPGAHVGVGSDSGATSDASANSDADATSDASATSDADATTLGEPRPPTTARELPKDSLPGYSILKEISRGGQGVVYQAIQRSTSRKVAIKVLRDGHFADAGDRARFEREVQILGQLKHANIVSIYDSGSVGGHAFFVMDYVSGKALDEWAADLKSQISDLKSQGSERGPKAWLRRLLEVFAGVCDAVHAAHLRGIIHRDLKPSNIRIDADGQPRVLDFGLAKVAGAAEGVCGTGVSPVMTLTGQFLGSLPWSSPEQAEGQPSKIDIRTDVYSLGVILYQLLTGRFPYDVTGNMRDVLDRILRAEPPRPSATVWHGRPARDWINDELDTIVLKCLAKERERRYQSAGELGRDIRHYLAGEAIEAKRDSVGYLLRKLASRHRGRFVGAVAFVALLGVAAGALSVLWRQARVAEHRARFEADTAEQINRFLSEDILSAADPGAHGGRNDITVREVLDAASTRLERGWLHQKPLVEAGLRTTVGRTYAALGHFDIARQHLQRAVTLRQANLSVEDLGIARGLAELSEATMRSGDSIGAELLARDALQRLRNAPDYRGIEVAQCLDLLTNLMWERGDVEGADRYAREALEACTAAPEGSRRERLEIGITRSLVYGLAGAPWEAQPRSPRDLEEAERLARSALQRAQEEFGREHPAVADLLHTLGWAVQARQNFEEAGQLHRAALLMREKLLGSDHNRLGSSKWYIAQWYLAQGRLGEAEEAFRALLGFNFRVDPNHWYWRMTNVELGTVLAAQHRFLEGSSHVERGCQELIKHAGVPEARRRWALQQCVALYDAWHAAEPGQGYDQKAAEWRGKLAALDAASQPVRQGDATASP